jgi:hypothetical protein
MGASAVGTTNAAYGSALTFASRGTTDVFLLNINGELFNDHASALWKTMFVDGTNQMSFVEHWHASNVWHDFSLTRTFTGLAAGNHTLQLALSADIACNVQGDWVLTVARLA